MNFNDEATSAQHYAYSLAEMKNLGVTSVRIWMTLDSYADRPNVWDTDPRVGQVDLNGVPLSSGYAGVMARAFQLKKLGYHVLLVISPDKNPLPASDADVVGFFQHLANATETPTSTLRLRDVVDQWEIGNEPDSQTYWADPSGDKTARLKSYVDKLLLPAASVLHGGERSTWAQVISAGLSYNPEDLNTILSYLASKSQLGAIDYAGFHPYGTYDPDTGANKQATNILLAKKYADSYGKKMIATEWSVRGYAVTGTQDDKYALALDLNYRNYILPNFESAYYFALVNNWPGRGGSTSARPAGVLEHADSTGISPALHPDLLGDYYASPLVRSQPFHSTVQGWNAVTPDVAATPGPAAVGAVWYDTNGDGTVNDQERLAGNQPVWIDLNSDGVHDPSEPSAVSDANGVFRIEYAPALLGLNGAIRVESAYPQTAAPAVSLGSTTQLLGVAVGLRPDFAPAARVKGSITGVAWNDANNNGVRESTEIAAAGRIVYVDENNDGVRQAEEYAVLAEPTGRYMFRFLNAGTYTVRVQGPVGEIAQSRVITIETDQRVLDQDLAIVPAASAVVTIEAETGVFANGTAASSGNGGFGGTGYADFAGQNSSAAWTVSRTTPATASIAFRYANGGDANRPLTIYVNNVAVGTVACAPTGGWTAWQTVALANVALPQGVVTVKAVAGTPAGGANLDQVILTPAGTTPPPTTGTISGFTFDDKNANGVFDGSDVKTSGKVVFLDADNDGVLDTGEKSVKTATDGSWSFSGLTAGVYHVRRVFPTGYIVSTPPIDITLTPGQSVTDRGIGSKSASVTPATATLSGFAFDDKNKNGVYDANDNLAAGKTIWLDLDDDGVLDSNETSRVTDSAGGFSFTGLAARAYHVRRKFPTGYVESTVPRYYTVSAWQVVTGIAIGSKVK